MLIEIVAGLQVLAGRWTRATMFKVLLSPISKFRIMMPCYVSVTVGPAG